MWGSVVTEPLGHPGAVSLCFPYLTAHTSPSLPVTGAGHGLAERVPGCDRAQTLVEQFLLASASDGRKVEEKLQENQPLEMCI